MLLGGKMKNTILHLTLFALLLSYQTRTWAQESSPIIVTATRTAITADSALASVTVIDRKQIEQQQATSVLDLLRGTPGLSIANNGGFGKTTSFFLRGAESDHVLVLVDGIKVGSATSGATAFEHIPIDQIERIEIVRGPASSLYGSEAIGGVIQIFTRKGQGVLTPSLSLETGSDKTHRAAANLSASSEKSWFNVGFSVFDTEGYNSCVGPEDDGCFISEPDRDGYNNTSISARVGHRFTNMTELEFYVLHTEYDTEYDGSGQNEAEGVQQVIGSRVSFNIGNNWYSTLRLGQSQDNTDNLLNGVFEGKYETTRDSISFQNDITLADNHILTTGIDYQDDQINEQINSTLSFAATSRDNVGVFAQYQAQLTDHDLQFNLRHDNNEQFGDEVTGRAAWGYNVTDKTRVTLSYGTAFKAPTFNELYFPFSSNANLKSEKSQSVELGLSTNLSWGAWQFNLYQTSVDNLIAYDSVTYIPFNIDEARIRGLETQFTTQVAQWRINTALTLIDPENRGSGTNYGNILPRRAQQSLALNVDRDFNDYSVGLTLRGEGRRYDDIANTNRLGSYITWDLRGEYRLDEAWRLQARVENLFDKDYQTARYYDQPGLGAYVTLRYQPQ